jgi:hypothetical protein
MGRTGRRSHQFGLTCARSRTGKGAGPGKGLGKFQTPLPFRNGDQGCSCVHVRVKCGQASPYPPLSGHMSIFGQYLHI